MGERYNGIVEVRGSIPLGSTKTPTYKKINVAREAGKIFGVAWLIFHSHTRFVLPTIMVQTAHRTICPDPGARQHTALTFLQC